MQMYAKLHSWENLLLAYRRAAKGKRGQSNVAFFEHNLEENLLGLQEALVTQTYQPGDYSSFFIHEPKRRLISAAPFRDRVVHHALCNLIEPTFERAFIRDSYANRKNKGTHAAIDRVQYFARRHPYVLQLDVRQFFPSIDYAILRTTLEAKVKDQRVLWLIDQILAGGSGILNDQYDIIFFPGDDLFAANRSRGLPIGNLTSQFWANCYMNPFDHFVKRQLGVKGYVRYVDDLVVFGDNKATLWQWKLAVEDRLAQLRMTVHPGCHPKPVTEGIPFLGFTIYPNQRRVKQRKVVHFTRRYRKNLATYQASEITLDELNASVQGWVNHVRYANTLGLRKTLFRTYKLSR